MTVLKGQVVALRHDVALGKRRNCNAHRGITKHRGPCRQRLQGELEMPKGKDPGVQLSDAGGKRGPK